MARRGASLVPETFRALVVLETALPIWNAELGVARSRVTAKAPHVDMRKLCVPCAGFAACARGGSPGVLSRDHRDHSALLGCYGARGFAVRWLATLRFGEFVLTAAP